MTQKEIIMSHLIKHGSITPLEAQNNYGIMRLGARIWELKSMGYSIKTESVKSKNRYNNRVMYAKYVLQKGKGDIKKIPRVNVKDYQGEKNVSDEYI